VPLAVHHDAIDFGHGQCSFGLEEHGVARGYVHLTGDDDRRRIREQGVRVTLHPPAARHVLLDRR
jgi:hypothetical protein